MLFMVVSNSLARYCIDSTLAISNILAIDNFHSNIINSSDTKFYFDKSCLGRLEAVDRNIKDICNNNFIFFGILLISFYYFSIDFFNNFIYY